MIVCAAPPSWKLAEDVERTSGPAGVGVAGAGVGETAAVTVVVLTPSVTAIGTGVHVAPVVPTVTVPLAAPAADTVTHPPGGAVAVTCVVLYGSVKVNENGVAVGAGKTFDVGLRTSGPGGVGVGVGVGVGFATSVTVTVCVFTESVIATG